MTRRWARPYVVTGGRGSGRHRLDTHTQVRARRDLGAGWFSPQARALYEQADGGPMAIAELSAHTGIPLGVTRVLVSDLIHAGYLHVAPHADNGLDRALLERLLDGLHAL